MQLDPTEAVAAIRAGATEFMIGAYHVCDVEVIEFSNHVHMTMEGNHYGWFDDDEDILFEGRLCDTDQQVTMAIDDGKLHGSIDLPDGEATLSSDGLFSAHETTSGNLHGFTTPEMEASKAKLRQYYQMWESLEPEEGRRNLQSLSPGEVNVHLKLDIDFSMVQHWGSAWAAARYGVELTALVNRDAFWDLGFNLIVAEINIHSRPIADGDCGPILTAVRRVPLPPNVHLQHAMTYSHVCGVVPSLTGLYDRHTGYGVSGFRHDWIFGKWDRTVYAHELGHAIGGPHTHEMNPPIDTCGSSRTRCPYRQGQGTIMSYCNACTGGLMNTRYEWHPRIVRAIHAAYNFYQRRGRSPMQTVSQCLQFNRHIPDNGLSFVLFGGSTCISEGIDYSACGNSCRVNTCNNDAFWYWDASSSNVRSGKEADYCWQTDNACSGISLQRCSNSGSQRFQISSQGIRSNQCGLVRFSGNRISFNSNNAIVRDYCLKGGNPTGLNVEGCVISEAERNWRLWPRRLPRTCEEADVLHQACTMDLPFSREVRENCPATCAMARQEPCPNGSTGGDSGPGDGPSGPGNGPSSECEPISCNQRATGTTRGSRAGTKCFTFEASQTSPIRFSTCGSQFDTMLDIQSGGLRVIAGDDEGDCGTRTILPVDAVAGSDYTIILTGFAGQTGNYVLEAQCPDFGDSDSSDDGPAADRYVAPSGCTCISVQHPSWGRIDSCTTPAGSGFAPFCYVTGTCAQQESGSVPGRFWADCVLDDDSSDVVDDSSDAGSDYFTMTGDCDVQGNCVSSANYPGRHGNRESCSVTMLRSASLTVSSTFNLETCCDHLMIRGVDTESSGAVPASLNSGETFTWTTDGSVTREGWQICFSGTTQTTGVETTTTRRVTTTRGTTTTRGPGGVGQLQCGSTRLGSTRNQPNRVGHSSGEATFEFTAPGGPVTFDLCDSRFDTYIRILQTSTGTEVAANDDHSGGCQNPRHRYASYLEVSLTAGETYTVVIEGYQNNEGQYELAVTCGNDGGDNSDTIACGQTVSGSTVGRSSSVGTSAGEATYQFVATARQYVFDGCQSSYDSLLRVYDSNGRQIGMNDDHRGRCGAGSRRTASHLTVSTTIGQTYTLVIEGYGVAAGAFSVSAQCSGSG